jgi:hypothetical protein
MAILPKVKLRTLVSFPAAVHGGTGVTVDSTAGTFTISLDLSAIAVAASIPAGDVATTYVLTYNTLTGTFLLVPP